MSLSDLLSALFGGEFNRAWSEPHYHEVHTKLAAYDVRSGSEKVYKQPGRILSFGDVPKDVPGIYIFRDTYKNTIYIGQTEKLGLRKRISQHLNGAGTKSLKEGILYEIRWAKTKGHRMEKIAEALAILHFSPSGNVGNDWKGNLNQALRDGLEAQVLGEAERLGFLKAKNPKDGAKYISKILAAVREA